MKVKLLPIAPRCRFHINTFLMKQQFKFFAYFSFEKVCKHEVYFACWCFESPESKILFYKQVHLSLKSLKLNFYFLSHTYSGSSSQVFTTNVFVVRSVYERFCLSPKSVLCVRILRRMKVGMRLSRSFTSEVKDSVII